MKIGIDFGTSFSLPAGMIDGHLETLLPGGAYGVPSVFYYDSKSGILIGRAAENRGNLRPSNVIREVKMEINQGNIKNFIADGKTFSKKQIVGHILQEIKSIALTRIRDKQLASQEIEGAIISVPAAFTLRELNFIRDVAQASGEDDGADLKVLGFIREPVAAAISYFNREGVRPDADDKKTILVYDLGGGTCDVAIVRADKDSPEWYKVIASDMKRIGGRDWDKLMVELIKTKCRAQNLNVEFTEKELSHIREIAVRAKHHLSQNDNFFDEVEAGGELYDFAITRAEFERQSSELLKMTMDMVDKLKRECSTKIDFIVCVGGSSNMPQVCSAFEERYPDFPKENIRIYEPEKAIAFGAAIYAEHFTETSFLRDICKFSYGARYIENYSKYKDKNRLRIYNIIYKDAPLPTSGTSDSYSISDGEANTYIAIYESECADYKYLPEDGTYIGEIMIKGIEDGRKGDKTLLTMTIDRSGLMHLEAVDERTGKTVHVDIQLEDY